MKNASQALMVTILACLASVVVGDLLVSALSIVVSVLKVAHAADVQMRQQRGPVCIRPYRFQFMR